MHDNDVKSVCIKAQRAAIAFLESKIADALRKRACIGDEHRGGINAEYVGNAWPLRHHTAYGAGATADLKYLGCGWERDLGEVGFPHRALAWVTDPHLEDINKTFLGLRGELSDLGVYIRQSVFLLRLL